MAKEPNNLLKLAIKDMQASKIILNSSSDELLQNIAAHHTQQAVEKTLKHMKVIAGSTAGIGHDIKVLIAEAKEVNCEIPEWVIEGAYDLSSWATSIRYNSNFKSNLELINDFNDKIEKWIAEIDR